MCCSLRFLPLLLLNSALLFADGVIVQFDPRAPEIGPFPSDFLTQEDASQKTGKRVNLPMPDCSLQPGTCSEYALLNQLDGFNVTPRLSVRFSGAIQPDSIRNGMFLVALNNLTNDEYGLHKEGAVIPLNQIIYDPLTNTAYAKPDEVIDQHRRFLLVITDGVRDAKGDPVGADWGYSNCSTTPFNPYCAELSRVLATVAGRFGSQKIVGASFFTTLSATAWLESARDALSGVSPSFRRTGVKNVFPPADLSGAVFRAQTGATPSVLTDNATYFSMLQGVGSVAFGSFQSPNFLDKQVIAQTPTGVPVKLPAATNEIFFHAMLPASAKPAGGYPVVIFGHGLGDNRFVGPTAIASTLASAGFATVTFNAVGHGFGPDGKFVVNAPGGSVELPAGGRGVDLDGNHRIQDSEGCVIALPAPVALRDCLRQTAVDQMQLVRAIQAGMDLDGDGARDLDPNQIYYVGHSLGAMYGTLLNAVSPAIPAAALNSGGGTVVDLARVSPAFRSASIGMLSLHVPNLLNKPGDFDDNYVLRYQPAKINTVPGAIDIQNFFERLEWLQASGDPLNFAPHLKSTTLAGVPIKSVLWQFGRGDQTVPNQSETALVRAANMRENTWLYRNDLVKAVQPKALDNPHIYLLDVIDAVMLPAALSAQNQIADFFASGGTAIPDPNSLLLRVIFGRDVFEVPQFLPEDPGWK